jgi:superfamily I DNA/RNA helicase
MNPFQRARDEAHAARCKLVPGKSQLALSAKTLLQAIEKEIGIAVEAVDADYPDLCSGSAVLQREQRFIYVTDEVTLWGDVFCGLVAHELGHWFLDKSKSASTVAHLKTLFGSEGTPAVVKVEAYGARERQELQANVFARELLLPRSVARDLAKTGMGPARIAKDLGIPLEFVRQQMLDALLLPNVELQSPALQPPSADQQAAATATERAANVVAGPGTGKTSTLIHRVKYLIDKEKVDPSQILVLTFTNKAAFELVERLRGAGIDRASEVWAGTFHSFGLEFLRKYHEQLELDQDLNVVDTIGSITMLAAALPQVDLKYYLRVEDPYDWLGPVVGAIKRLKEELVSPEAYRTFVIAHPETDAELQRRRQDVATLYEAHERLLAERRTVDFVDLISKPALALRVNRVPYADLVDNFKHVLVDEYQDVTQAMVELLRQVAKAKSIWVVGDVRQAIHHWRGASLKSLLKFEAEFKAHAGDSKIQRYALDTNRRSTEEILDLVREVGRQHKLESTMPLDKMVAKKGLCGELPVVITCARRMDLLSAVVAQILALKKRGTTFGQQAVLSRGAADVQQAAAALESAGIPVIYIGELAQRIEVKRLLCLMQLLVERQPRALVGLMEVPGLAMPSSDFHLLMKAAEADVAYQRARWLDTPPPGISSSGSAVIAKLRKLLAGHRFGSNPWSFVCDMILEHRYSLPSDEDASVASWVQRIALWQFAYAVRNGDGDIREARLSRFLIRQRLRQRLGETYVDRELPSEASQLDGVRLLTVHGSKGLEFEAVHVAYVNASSYGAQAPDWSPPESVLDLVPPEALGSSQAEFLFEEAVERNNLLYVAVSRAKRHLVVYQENEFGDHTLAPQLEHFPLKYKPLSYSGPATHTSVAVPPKGFTAPNPIKFEHLDMYVLCGLQYWYSHVLHLRSEADLDSSIRARIAVMSTLKTVASGKSESPLKQLSSVWESAKLPSPNDDPTLWRDAKLAFSRGLKLVNSYAKNGGKYAEPTSVVGGMTIQLPWGFVTKGPNSIEYSMIRFARRRVSELSTVLKPVVPGLVLNGTKTMSLSYVLSDKVDMVPGAKKVELTKTFKAAVRFLNGENQPTRGRHCARCAFMTICPSSPNELAVSGAVAAVAEGS